jgi:hypothetical protein
MSRAQEINVKHPKCMQSTVGTANGKAAGTRNTVLFDCGTVNVVTKTVGYFRVLEVLAMMFPMLAEFSVNVDAI